MLRHQSTRIICWLLLVVFWIQTTGCHSWKATTQPWPLAVAVKPVARYRIVTVDGRRFEVDTVRVVLDSVFGFGVPEPPKAGPVPPPVKVGLSINQISRVEEHRFSVIKTVLVVGGVLAVLIGLAGLDLYLAMEE